MWMKLLKISLLDEIWDSLESNRINLNWRIIISVYQETTKKKI